MTDQQQSENLNTPFNLNNYFNEIDQIIFKILSRPSSETTTYDILDTSKSTQFKLIALRETQRQMKIGEIWQEILGKYDGFISLKCHESGLDILSHTKKIAIELKNRTNTDNASSRKSNFNKLSKFKKQNPEYTCIYANINASTRKKTFKGEIKKIMNEGVEIEQQIGYEFLKFMLNEDTNVIVEFVKNTIDKYT